jgi:TRAP-type mannitol/chloroaromatic compound transport system substrate-binding protein
MKYRTVGLATNVLTAMGMVVRQLPGGEIQPAMKTGLIEAAEFNNPTSDSQFGMQDVSKHYHLGSFHQSQEMFEIPMNKKKYNSLAPKHQRHLRQPYLREKNSAQLSLRLSVYLAIDAARHIEGFY